MIDQVLLDISSAILVRHIETPISLVRKFGEDDSQGEVLAFMDEHQFDAAPVWIAGELAAWVRQRDLGQPAAPLSDVIKPVTTELLVESRAPLLHLLDRFGRGAHFLFVVGGDGISGVVTPSDLGKQAGRTHLFLELSALELALASRVRDHEAADGDWLVLLPEETQKKAMSRYNRDRQLDIDTDLVAGLDFTDLVRVTRELSPRGAVWRELTDEDVTRLTRFRNSVMHAVLTITTDDEMKVENLISNTRLVSQLLDSVGD